MEKLKTHMRFQYIDTKGSFIIFWGIVVIFDILGHIGNIVFQNTNFGINHDGLHSVVGGNYVAFGINHDGLYSVVGGNYVAIGIFIIVTGIVMYTESFPTLIGFGSTRKDFYKGSILYYVLLSLAMAVVQVILIKIEQIIAPSLGVEVYSGFELGGVKVFFALLILCAVFNLLGVIIYRIGYWTWILIAVVLAFTSISILRTSIVTFYDTVLSGNMMLYCLTITLFSAMLFFIGWLLIRKHDIKSKI